MNQYSRFNSAEPLGPYDPPHGDYWGWRAEPVYHRYEWKSLIISFGPPPSAPCDYFFWLGRDAETFNARA